MANFESDAVTFSATNALLLAQLCNAAVLGADNCIMQEIECKNSALSLSTLLI